MSTEDEKTKRSRRASQEVGATSEWRGEGALTDAEWIQEEVGVKGKRRRQTDRLDWLNELLVACR
jgi:hypothetical protein